MGSQKGRYETFGWDYERFSPLTEKEIGWYVYHARNNGGPVLELACGSGRLALEMAMLGLETEALDISPQMLEIAKKRVRGCPADLASKIRLHNLNMTDFHLERQFGLVILADNSFGQLETREHQMACLQRVFEHLRPDGKFLMTVRHFKKDDYPSGRREIEWSELIPDPKNEASISRRIRLELVTNGERIRSIFEYMTIWRDGRVTMDEFSEEAPVMLKADYLDLLAQAGLRSEVFVDYELRAGDIEGRVYCFVCEKS